MNSLDEYVEKLSGADETERIYAAEDIGYLNTANGVAALMDRLGRESSRAVRDAIFQALIRIEADAAIEAAIRLLENDEPQMRNQAVDVLRHKGAASVPFLDTAMRNGNKDLRKLVLDVLSGLQTSGTDGIYEAALADKDPNVVMTAVENVGRARATQFRHRIETLLLDEGSHPMLVAACLEALGGVGDELSLGAIRRRFPDLAAMPAFFLVSCLKAVGALGSTGEFVEVAGLLAVSDHHLRPAILGALIAIHQQNPAETFAAELLPVLKAVIENGDPPLCRYEAARALGLLADRDDVYSFLVSCLSNPERWIRLGAIESLRSSQRPGLKNVLASHAQEETDEEVLLMFNCSTEQR